MLRLRNVILAICLLSLGACSGTTFFYNRLDFILPWYLDDYVDLDRQQEEYLDDLLLPFLNWHRNEELPRYVAVLEDIESRLDQPLTIADLEAVSLEFERAWFRLQAEFLDWMLDMGGQISQSQVESFLAQLWKQQEEYQEEYLDRPDKEYRDDSYDSLLDSMQDYLGRLGKEQRALLQQASLELKRSDSIWLTERAAWLERLGVQLQREPGWEQRIRELVAERDENLGVEYRQTYEHNMRVIHGAVAEVINQRTERQDRRLRAELSDLREDLQTLIAQGQAAATGA